MGKIKQIIYGFRLDNVRKNLRKNAIKIREAVEEGGNYLGDYNEQLRLMSCKSYLENKFGGPIVG